MENSFSSSFTPQKTSSTRNVLLLRDVSSPHIVTQLTCGLRSLYRDSDDESSHSIVSQNEEQHFTRSNGEFWAEPGMMLTNRYRIRSCSKTTSQSAVVMEAQDCFQHMLPVKIKITHRSYLAVGLKEVDTLRRLNTADPGNNSHTIRLLNAFMIREHVCLVFPLLNSMSVTQIMMTKRLDEEQDWRAIKKITIRLLTALAFLRSQNTIHADIKPDNILLNKSGDPDTATLIDFGNAIHHTHEEVSLYYTDFELQTLPYRAPEVHLGIPFGVEVDMWSLGCVLAELYTGSPLFSGTSRVDTLKKMTAILGALPADMCMRGKYHSEAETAKLTSKTFPQNKPENGVTSAQRLMDGLPGLRNYQFASFLSGLLVYHPDKRLTPWEALQHQFLASEICIPYFLSEEVADPHIIKKGDYSFTHNISSTVRRLCPSTFDLLRHGTADQLFFEGVCDSQAEPTYQQAVATHGSSDNVSYVRVKASYHTLCSDRHMVPSPRKNKVLATAEECFNPQIVEESPKVESLPFITHPVKVKKLSNKTFDIHPFVMAQDDEKSHGDQGWSSPDIKVENTSRLHSECFHSWPVQDCQDNAHKTTDSVSGNSHDRTKCYPCMPSCSHPRKRQTNVNSLAIETKSPCRVNLSKPMSEMKEEDLPTAELKDSHDIVKTFTNKEDLLNVSTDTYVVKHHLPSLNLNLSTATYAVHSTHKSRGKTLFPSLSSCGNKESVTSSTKVVRHNRRKTGTVVDNHSPSTASSLNHCHKQMASNSCNLQSVVSPGMTCRRQYLPCSHEDSLEKDSPNLTHTPRVTLNRIEHPACDVPAEISLDKGNNTYVTGGYKSPRRAYYVGRKNWTESRNSDFREEENDTCKNISLRSHCSETLSENEVKVRQLQDKRKYLKPSEGCNNSDRKFVTTKSSVLPGRNPRMMTSRQGTHRTHKLGNLSHSSHGSTVDGIQPDSHSPDPTDCPDSALISSGREDAGCVDYTMTGDSRCNSGEDDVLEVHSYSHGEEEANSFSEEDDSALNTTFIVEHPSVELVIDEKMGFPSPQMKCKSKSACSEKEYDEEIGSIPLQINSDDSDIDYASIHSNDNNCDEECVGFDDEDIDSGSEDKLLAQESTSKMEQDVLLNTESNGFQTDQIFLGSRIEKQVINSQEYPEICQNIGTGNSGHSVSSRPEKMVSLKQNLKRALDNTELSDQVKDEMLNKDDVPESGFRTCKDKKSKKMEPCCLEANASPKNLMKDSLRQEEDETTQSTGSSTAEDKSSSQQEHKVIETHANNTQISGRKGLRGRRTRKRRMRSDVASFTVRSKRMQKRTARSKLVSYTTERVSALYTDRFMYEGSSKIKDGKTHLKQLAVTKSRIPSKSIVSGKRMKVTSAKLRRGRKKRAKAAAAEDKSYETVTSCNADSGISTSGQDFDETDRRIGYKWTRSHKKCKTVVAGINNRKTKLQESPLYSQKHLSNKHISPDSISAIKTDDPNSGNKTQTRVSSNVPCPDSETNATVSPSPKVINEVANDAKPVISGNFNMCITGKDIHRNLLAYQPVTVERRPDLKTRSSSAGRLSRARAVKRALNFQTHTTPVTDMHTPVGRPRQRAVSKLTPSSVQNSYVSQTRLKTTSTPTGKFSNVKKVKKRLLQSFTSSPNKSQNSDPYEFKVTPRKTTASLSKPWKARSAKSVKKPVGRPRKTSQRGRKKICSVDNSYSPANINIGDLVVQKSKQLFLGQNETCDKSLLCQSSGRQEIEIASSTQASVCPVGQNGHPCEDHFSSASGEHPSRKSGTEKQNFLLRHEQPVVKWPENLKLKSVTSNSTQLSCGLNEVKDSIITSIKQSKVAILQKKSYLGKNHQPSVDTNKRHKPEPVASAEQVSRDLLVRRHDYGGNDDDCRIIVPVKRKRFIADESSQVPVSLPISQDIYDEPVAVNNLEEEILLLD